MPPHAQSHGKIPTTVFTGFLGAGKTSLIRNLLRQSAGRRLALIINEFGDIGIDRELLLGCGDASCAEDDIVELANGCICCTVADDFVPTMRRLIERALPPEHIVIETSGLALPKPLIKAFNWPEIRTRVTVDGVVAVVDAAAVRDGLFAEDPEAIAVQRAADPALDHESALGRAVRGAARRRRSGRGQQGRPFGRGRLAGGRAAGPRRAAPGRAPGPRPSCRPAGGRADRPRRGGRERPRRAALAPRRRLGPRPRGFSVVPSRGCRRSTTSTVS